MSVENAEPITVKVEDSEPIRVRNEQDRVAATRATTTDRALAGAKVEADIQLAKDRTDADILRTDDQRRISGMWERTQQIIALSVVEVTLIVVAILVLGPGLALVFGSRPTEASTTAANAGMIFLASVANLVIGFYFGRTNHSRTGGDAATRRDA